MVRQKVVRLIQPHPNPPQSWGRNPAQARVRMTTKMHLQTLFFSPKTGGDSEGVESLTVYTPLTVSRTLKSDDIGSIGDALKEKTPAFITGVHG